MEVQVGSNLTVGQWSPTYPLQFTGCSISWSGTCITVWIPTSRDTRSCNFQSLAPLFNGEHRVKRKVYQHSDVTALGDTESWSQKYPRIQSNVQAVPKDLWSGWQSTKRHEARGRGKPPLLSLHSAGNSPGTAFDCHPSVLVASKTWKDQGLGDSFTFSWCMMSQLL